jgi:hypothetical protein
MQIFHPKGFDMNPKRMLTPIFGLLVALAPFGGAKAEEAPSTSGSNAQTWALLVGISKYQNPMIASLRFPSADATAVRDAMTDPQLGGLPADHVKLLVDDQATQSNILGAVDDFLKPNVKPGDKVILFLAGHGVAKGVGLDAKGYFLSADVKGVTTAMLDSSAVSLKTLSDKLSALPASQFVLFVDACREDPTPGRGVKGNTMSDVLSRGIQITPESNAPVSTASFFACSIGQRAFEDPTLEHGVFTYWILDGIRKAAVPRKPDGAIDMGVLASYVKEKVEDWAKQTSAKGDFEIEQTPEIISNSLSDPIILMTVSRPLSDSPIAPSAPSLIISTDPEGAQVSLDGAPIGAGPLTKDLPKGGDYKIKVEAPGYESAEKTVTALDGYDLFVTVDLKPGSRGLGPSANATAEQRYQDGQTAETKTLWEVAAADYQAAIDADPKFGAAYESLARLQYRQGKQADSITTLKKLTDNVPSAHSYSRLSLAYSLYASKNAVAQANAKAEEKPKKKGFSLGGLFKKKDDDKKDDAPKKYSLADLGTPKDADQAAAFAQVAADQAIQLDASSAEANQALGLARVAQDKDGSNKEDALAPLGKAVAMDANNAEYPYSLGFAIRRYAEDVKDDGEKKAELQRAVASLKQALDLRPSYYEAHRELAYCYHLMDDLPAAQQEYELADSYRGEATDEDEVAAINLSLAAIHSEEATKSGDPKAQKDQKDASAGYLTDAKEISPDLTRALLILNRVRLGSRLTDFLPDEIRRFMPDQIKANVQDKLKLNVRFP